MNAADNAQPADTIYSLPVLYAVFFVSGIAALLYQLLWQRALFAIYGTNTESVTIVVAAFMLGLGLGSIAGGKLSKTSRLALPLVFALLEVSIGLYGFASLSIFEFVGHYTTGVSVWVAGVLTFCLVVVPTSLMGATFPILVAYVVNQTHNVGKSVGTLYFVNTLGSAMSCFIAASLLFRVLGMSGTVYLAAVINLCVGLVVVGLWLLRRPH